MNLKTYKIEMLKDVCATGRTFKKGEILTVHTPSELSGPHFNGATFDIDGFPYKKFFWWDEFTVVR